jgi:hypothetical protein
MSLQGRIDANLKRREPMPNQYTRHGMRKHPLWQCWQDAKARCYRPAHRSYKWYGARGITMCPEWRNSSGNFIAWGLSNGYEAGLQLDRENNKESYNPGNCRFVTPEKNLRNSRSTYLSPAEISEIRAFRKHGVSARVLAEEYHTTVKYIYVLWPVFYTWKEVEPADYICIP